MIVPFKQQIYFIISYHKEHGKKTIFRKDIALVFGIFAGHYFNKELKKIKKEPVRKWLDYKLIKIERDGIISIDDTSKHKTYELPVKKPYLIDGIKSATYNVMDARYKGGYV